MTTTPEFIVLDASLGAPLVLVLKSTSLWKDIPEGGILRRGTSGDPVTVFAARSLAAEAVRRTESYDARKDLERGRPGHPLELSISRLERRAV